jgi:uncharacterized Tic20 family protein
MKSVPSTEERVWAVLSHLSALAFGMGILLPVIGWSEQRRKSNFATFQSLQALGYQSLGYTFWILGSFVIIVIHSLFTVRELISASQSGPDPAGFLGPAMSLHFVVMLGLIGLYFLMPFVAAIVCALGRDFRYPIMGDRLARYLGYEPLQIGDEKSWLIEDHEDRWVVAMGHFSVIIALWGMLVPLTAWILQGNRSLFLKFQSIQTLVFQGSVMLLYILAGAIYVFGFIALILTVGIGADELSPSGGMIGLAILFISMLIAIFLVLLIPSFHILGQWAGYRVLKGDNYRYALIGRLVEKWISNKSLPPPDTDVLRSTAP